MHRPEIPLALLRRLVHPVPSLPSPLHGFGFWFLVFLRGLGSNRLYLLVAQDLQQPLHHNEVHNESFTKYYIFYLQMVGDTLNLLIVYFYYLVSTI
jgi:hypothetical protein